MGHRVALVVLATATVVCVLGCGSSKHQSAAPTWLHRLAQKQAHIFSESHPSRVSRVKLIVGSKDAIELWGRFDCNEDNCSLGTCEPPDGSVQRHSNQTCVIRFRYIRLAVDPRTHRIGLVQKLRGTKPSTG